MAITTMQRCCAACDLRIEEKHMKLISVVVYMLTMLITGAGIRYGCSQMSFEFELTHLIELRCSCIAVERIIVVVPGVHSLPTLCVLKFMNLMKNT